MVREIALELSPLAVRKGIDLGFDGLMIASIGTSASLIAL